MTTGIGTYLNSIGRIPLLTPQQEIELGRQVVRMHELRKLDRPLTKREQHEVKLGERAIKKFTEANLRLVVTVAKKYAGIAHSMDMLDLIQEGNIALAHAASKFDPERGYKFSTYCFWWIRQSMTRAMRYKDRAIRLPGNIADMPYTWGPKYAALQQQLGRKPTREELAVEFRVSPDDVDLFLERGARIGSLDARVGDDGDSSLLELMADPNQQPDEVMEQAVLSERYARMQEALAFLDPKDRDMVVRRFALAGSNGTPCTLQELSNEYGISRERVRQIIRRALDRMKLMMASTVRVAA